MSNILFIDNFDSFSYNLVDQFLTLGHSVTVYNNTVDVDKFVKLAKSDKNNIVVISPGPGSPKEAGNLVNIIKEIYKNVPILGICLGHQTISYVLGGDVVSAPEKVHGKLSPVTHNNDEIHHGLDNPLMVARYHSLMVDNLPPELEANSYHNDIIMSIKHKYLPIIGFQYHPESVMTFHGEKLLKQSLDYLSNFNKNKSDIL